MHLDYQQEVKERGQMPDLFIDQIYIWGNLN